MTLIRDYKRKLHTPEQAVRLIESGDDIFIPLCAGQPPALLDALPSHEGLLGNRLYQMLTMRPPLDIAPERLQVVSLFLGSGDRPGFRDGLVDLLPNHFSDLAAQLQQITKNRVLMATVSPMDEDGYFSIGTNADYVSSLIEDAKLILLEVNEKMPRTYGENRIHLSQVSALVEHHVELPVLLEPVITANDEMIGRHIAEIIRDGDNLQIGFGAIPNAVMNFLHGHKNLGIFTEMLPDKVVDLCMAGVINGSNKSIYPGQMTTTFALGSRKLYDFLHENKDVVFLPASWTNDVRIISQVEQLVSINATVEVDFLGQCNSEMVGGRYYSSTGGQADFAQGARMAKDGRGIICLHSTAKNETISKIVPTLYPGSAISNSKNDVDIVVTENGVAKLRGKTIRERTCALISIAHPKFREELTFQARKMGYLL
ncbi:4-hydroxybutyrate CoA-transferase [Tumebacillus algifaecis]|uniref:4-hydroxybutyrate CoA-transferase n=1 Tax=Tumebacillus algifaecis TaxID=1214604 RepID=A0A223CZE2_9BACL|nr:acetyl-CoA hydrolase/transferase C-terminal domain-containing protein [Tumebacillus algifaecis]ASS74702.1 4-hydroxybutyrate CoA-transferase [Tumebacillus algifaecis]